MGETNGCGGKGSWIKIPNFIFKASCNKHDNFYNEGGKEIDRYIADLLFYWYMLIDVKAFALKYWYIFPISYTFAFTWASLYMLAVRIGGRKYYNYK